MTKFFNKISNGNSLEILKRIPDKTFDLVFADPPYNMQIGEKLKDLMIAKLTVLMISGINFQTLNITMTFPKNG